MPPRFNLARRPRCGRVPERADVLTLRIAGAAGKEHSMKRVTFAALVLVAGALALAPAAFATPPTNQTTISVTVGAEAWISVPSTGSLTSSTSDFSNPYTGSTVVSYKVRTTQS